MSAIEWLVGAVLDFGDALPRRKRVLAGVAVGIVLAVSPDTFARAAQASAQPLIDAWHSSLPVP